MRVLTNLLFKVTLSSMILTAPAMISGNQKYADGPPGKEIEMPFYSSVVINRYITHLHSTSPRLAVLSGEAAAPSDIAAVKPAAAIVTEKADNTDGVPVSMTGPKAPLEHRVTDRESSTVLAAVSSAEAKAAELKMVIGQAVSIYSRMGLEKDGLDEKAFEYAWRGYHNLVKRGMIKNKGVLSICDFTQSCCSRRLYVIDVLHRRLLFRTYVAHGQKSGDEFATSFSNEPESFKSSLGFYITEKTYIGHNGLSLRLNGLDVGYNDMALKRRIVLHGSTYVGDQYMQNFGTLGTSLGCPALPSAESARIIRMVKNGSCLFIYHPSPEYLDYSTIING